MIQNQAVLELLRESLLRRYVQHAMVSSVKPVTIRGHKTEVIVLLFNGVPVYCKKEDFSKRQMSTFSGFIGTSSPFIVKEILDNNVVLVSRIEALPIVQQRFLRLVKVGDTVRGTVTGFKDESGLVFVEVQGYPCLIPPGELDINMVSSVSDIVGIGTEIECQVISMDKIEDVSKGADVDFEYRIRLSRKVLLKEELNKAWEKVEEFHSPGDQTLGRIVNKNPGPNSYLVQLASSGIVILANLTRPLNEQFRYSELPQGLQVKLQIVSLDKAQQRGKARIYQIDPSMMMSFNSYANF